MLLDGKRASVKENRGLAVFCAFAAFALIKLELQSESLHYRLFSTVARLLWQGQTPYGSDLGSGSGLYFYSPTCGLFWFGLFAWMPTLVGLFFYMLASLVLLVGGARALMAALRFSPRQESLFWLLIAPTAYTAILTAKLELAITGILLLTTAWLIQRRRPLASASLLALIINWKFQPLPIALLFILAAFGSQDPKSHKKPGEWNGPAPFARAFTLAFVISLGIWFALPLIVIPAHTLGVFHGVWLASLRAFAQTAWMNFENIFAFLAHLGVPLTLGATQALSALAALGIALGYRASLKKAPWPDAILLAAGMGSAYAIVFSPLGQNNALVLWSPLLLLALHQKPERGLASLFGLGALAMGWAYSDLIPPAPQAFLRTLEIKPPIALLIALGCLAHALNKMVGSAHGQ